MNRDIVKGHLYSVALNVFFMVLKYPACVFLLVAWLIGVFDWSNLTGASDWVGRSRFRIG